MKSLKKSVIAVLVIGTLSMAGMAAAHPYGNRQGFCHGRGPGFGYGPCGDQYQQRGWGAVDMPEEIRAKAEEAAKLRIELRSVLSQEPLNREKAVALEGQISKLHQDIRAWHFERHLRDIEACHKEAVDQPVSK
ncbi:MAG: hypothetical protein K6E38_05305 [Fretibacterium sp.]|nr:hypothetical protein [Fretibacterium sp.]